MIRNAKYTRRTFLIAAGSMGTGLGGCTTLAAPARYSRYRRRADIKALVLREAIDLKVPPDLALAVAHAESNFDPLAESSKGARGVMQIMPATARGEYGLHPDDLWHPRVNVRVGLDFLKRLIDRYRGRIDWALSYYNGGSAVGPPSRARIIPATRPYLRRVNHLRRQYRRALERGTV